MWSCTYWVYRQIMTLYDLLVVLVVPFFYSHLWCTIPSTIAAPFYHIKTYSRAQQRQRVLLTLQRFESLTVTSRFKPAINAHHQHAPIFEIQFNKATKDQYLVRNRDNIVFLRSPSTFWTPLQLGSKSHNISFSHVMWGRFLPTQIRWKIQILYCANNVHPLVGGESQTMSQTITNLQHSQKFHWTTMPCSMQFTSIQKMMCFHSIGKALGILFEIAKQHSILFLYWAKSWLFLQCLQVCYTLELNRNLGKWKSFPSFSDFDRQLAHKLSKFC